MINFPDKYKTKIINRYGKEGEDWLNNINNVIEKVILYIKDKASSDRILRNINVCKKILKYID